VCSSDLAQPGAAGRSGPARDARPADSLRHHARLPAAFRPRLAAGAAAPGPRGRGRGVVAERLQKLMAQAGYGSRRANEALIRAGRVRVNDRVARLGDRADPEKDTVTVDGQPLELQKPVYVMLHKPRGVLSSTEDELEE